VSALHVGLRDVEMRERERAVAEARVEVAERGPLLALDSEQPVGRLLHVVDAVAHAQRDVAAARAAGVRLDVDPGERGRRLGARRDRGAGEQRAPRDGAQRARAPHRSH